MIVTICGQAGSGKDTVGKIIARMLGYKFISAGNIRREMAKERGLTLVEFNKLGEKESFTDTEVDEYQKRLGEEKDNLVMVGRTSYHFVPTSVKVFLKANLEERARRVSKQKKGERMNEPMGGLDDIKKKIGERDIKDRKRYIKWYGIDVMDERNYDLVVDATHINARQVADRIMDFIKKNGVKPAKR